MVTGTNAYVRAMVQFDRSRGWPLIDILHTLFPEDAIRAQATQLAFERSFQAAIDRFGVLPLPGIDDVLATFNEAGIKTCLVSGLSRPALSLIVERLGWWQRADLILCTDDVRRGFPWPDLMLTAMLRLGTGDVRKMALVTASQSGVVSAQRAGAPFIVGMAGGGHDVGKLRKAGATHVLAGIGELPGLLASADQVDTAPLEPQASS